jgi:aminoglycoside phosphotransferase (APT) family kinase protein
MDDETWQARIDAEISRLRARINDSAVREFASKLNGGRKCSIEHGDMMGCANYHAHVRFEDGSGPWLLRVPRVTKTGAAPAPMIDYLVASEYATLRFLENTSVPAPRAFGYGTRCSGTDHGIGVSFLLIEELPGKPWELGGIPAVDGEAEEGQKAKIWERLADIFAELARHPLPKAGSLSVDDSSRSSPPGIQVGPTASDRWLVLTLDGPFESARDYYTAWAEQYLDLIADRQLYNAYPVEAYLVYRFLKEKAAAQLADEEEEDAEFFVKHVDDHGGHILVDDDLNITGIIDWQMARVVPRVEAFGPSLVSVDIEALGTGRLGLGVDDAGLTRALRKRGHDELARRMEEDGNERARRFFWGLALEPSWERALPLANAILRAFGVHQDWEEWRHAAMREWSADKRLRKLARARPPVRVYLHRQAKEEAYAKIIQS